MPTFIKRAAPGVVGWLAAFAIGIGVAACGGGHTKPAASTSASPAATQSASRSSAPATNAGIPQHNGGDQDADNNGGPSDGDGEI